MTEFTRRIVGNWTPKTIGELRWGETVTLWSISLWKKESKNFFVT